MSKQTTTPRTDLASFRPTGAAEVVFADFARQLERELTAAHATIEELRRERIAADNERLRLEGLNRVANTERNDAVKRLADLRAQLEGLTKERDALKASVEELSTALPLGFVRAEPTKYPTYTKPAEPTFLPVHGPATGGANTEQLKP